MTIYKEVRALARGLEVLSALNQANGATTSEIAAKTGVHRTTVRRILETLAQTGYVSKAEAEDRFLLCHKVRSLSVGYTSDAWITECAGPFLRRLVNEVVWPTELATLDGDAMVVRQSTQRLSPLSIFRSMIATRWPIMMTAIGRAYLAYCDDEERERLLAVLGRSELSGNQLARSATYVSNLIERTREVGYASSVEEAADRISAIALPVRHGPKVLGSINIIFFSSAMTVSEAAEQYLPRLRSVVASIELHLQQNVADTAATEDRLGSVGSLGSESGVVLARGVAVPGSLAH